MNSHRDNVKDAMRNCLDSIGIENDLDELVYVFADAVFDALGITEDEQDKIGGYFMLHANKGEKVFLPPPLGEELPEDAGEFTSTMETSLAPESEYVQMTAEEEAEHDKRVNELATGAKYTLEEFKAYAEDKRSYPENTEDWYITLQTPICRYGQNYTKQMSLDHAKTKFANFYYPMYLEDYERSKDIVQVDKEPIQ